VIGVAKPANPPAILTEETTLRRVADLCERYERFADEYRSGKKRFTFDDRIYNHPTVKAALIRAQRGKCCFCETRIEDEGDIEHYRPKSGSRQSVGDKLARPGYYWLAYDWDNLLLACSSCNQRFKRNLFPLRDPARRARIHIDDIGQEEPLLLNPANDNPERFIAFRAEVPYVINGNLPGETTIRILGLARRKSLNERRRVHLARLLILWDLIALEDEYRDDPEMARLIARARQELDEATGDAAEFASSTRCAIQDRFRYVRTLYG
jgi:uncharacterized protein (TIGR02646 family)